MAAHKRAPRKGAGAGRSRSRPRAFRAVADGLYELRVGARVVLDLLVTLDGEGMDNHARWINHSCAPNAGIVGNILVVAMRDIGVGEEICFDYAMCDAADYDEFTCACGEPDCRGVVTGADWKLPELRERYDGWRSTYLQRRIDAKEL